MTHTHTPLGSRPRDLCIRAAFYWQRGSSGKTLSLDHFTGEGWATKFHYSQEINALLGIQSSSIPGSPRLVFHLTAALRHVKASHLSHVAHWFVIVPV